MPWTGKNWGMIAIPRIGQEVVVQFEDGNPDRPIVTGMLYNADTLPPYTLPANATQTGMKTQSSKSGSAETYNELVFEDKKNEEFVRLQSEKDFTQIIKNNATITIGAEKQDNGDLTQTIFGHKIETLDTGDHTFTVSEGNQTIAIKKDHDETIEGTSTQTITGDTMQIIKTGNVTQSIKTGNLTQTVAKGNATYEASMGDYKITAGAGKIDIEAALSITLKVGANEVKIDPSGVSIKGTTFKAEGTAMATMKGPKALVDGSAMLELKGGLVKIN
jgi:type VI secretion system secreted protein VgrG